MKSLVYLVFIISLYYKAVYASSPTKLEIVELTESNWRECLVGEWMIKL